MTSKSKIKKAAQVVEKTQRMKNMLALPQLAEMMPIIWKFEARTSWH